MAKIELHNEDCIPAMKQYPDNYFSLAICDPPYGIDIGNDDRFGKKTSKKAITHTKNYTKKDWDLDIPTKEYFNELFRVSKNQIIWGVNYFPDERLCGGRIFWDKDVPENYSKSKGEIAYKSYGIGVDYIKVTWHGMLQYDMKNKEIRIHPTQKPVQLYRWLLHNYAKEGDKILDTHLGSGSIAIACHDMEFDLTGYEIDKEYFDAACKRIETHKLQLKLF